MASLLHLAILVTFVGSTTDLPPGHLCHVMLYEFTKGTSAHQTAANINQYYGTGSTTDRTCRTWFEKFRSGDRSLTRETGQGHPHDLDDTRLLALVNQDNTQSTRDLAEALGVSHTTVERHFKNMGYAKKLGRWLPHALTEAHMLQRMSIAAAHLSRYERKSFLPRLITGDEKWMLTVNFRRKRQWVGPGETPKPDVRPDQGPSEEVYAVCLVGY